MKNLERGYRYATIEHQDYGELIGRRFCLNPELVTAFLQKLDNDPGKACRKFFKEFTDKGGGDKGLTWVLENLWKR